MDNPFDDMINVSSLTALCKDHFKEFGYMEFIPEEEYPGSGSSDIGNVSYVCPTAYMEIAPKKGGTVIVHDQSAMDVVNSNEVFETVEPVIKSYVRAAIDICLNDELLETVRNEHKETVAERMENNI